MLGLSSNATKNSIEGHSSIMCYALSGGVGRDEHLGQKHAMTQVQGMSTLKLSMKYFQNIA